MLVGEYIEYLKQNIPVNEFKAFVLEEFSVSYSALNPLSL